MKSHLVPVLAALSCLCAAPARAQQVDPAAAAQELAKVFERPAGTTIDPKVAGPRFKEFFARYEGKDLGPLSYARALQAYMDRDSAKAVEELDAFFAKHEAIKDDEHRKMAGRIYIMALNEEGKKETPDEERLRRIAERAARLYRPSAGTLARMVRSAVASEKVKSRDDILAAVAAIVLASEQTSKEKVTALEELFGGAAKPAGRTAPAERAAQGPAADAKTDAKIDFPQTKAMSGKAVSLADYQGKVVLVDFWATWCGPCMNEMPNVAALYEKLHDQGLEIVGVSLDRPNAEGQIQETEKKFGMKWEQIYDGGGWQAAFAVKNGIHSIPAVFVVDRTGKVRYTPADRLRGAKLEQAIAALIAEKAPN